MRSELHQVIRNLYVGASRVPVKNFQNFALDTLSGLIRFDSAVWATGVHEPHELHTVHLFNQAEALLNIYESGLVEQDFVRAGAIERLGETVLLTDLCSREAFEAMPVYTNLCKPLGIEQSMATCVLDPVTGLYEYIALWRNKRDHAFKERDRSMMQVMMIHLVTAWQQARITHLRSAHHVQHEGLALSDRLGYLHASEPHFESLLRTAWPQWRGPALPAAIVDALADNDSGQDGKPIILNIEKLNIDIRPEGRLFRIALVQRHRAGGLTDAEHRVCALYASGHEHRDIAAQLGISRFTVRNQIASAYRKLGVSNKAELALRIR